jgi:GTPase SAR1 family protein
LRSIITISTLIRGGHRHEQQVLKILLGNKTDLPDRQISTEQGQAIAKEFDVRFFETSAKDGSNVEDGTSALPMRRY